MNTPDILCPLLRTTLFLTASGLVCCLALRNIGDRMPRLSRFFWIAVLLTGWFWFRPVVSIPWKETEPAPVTVVMTTTEMEPVFSRQPVLYHEAVQHPKTVPTVVAEPMIDVKKIEWKPLIFKTVLAVWLGGMVVSIFLSAAGYVRFLSLLRKTVPAGDDFAGAWRRLLEQHGIDARSIPMFVSNGRHDLGPALVRTVRGYRLVVPNELWSELSESGRCGILKHELEHFRRRDVWKSFFVRVLALPHWFNPVAHLALHRFEEGAELLCDRAAFECRQEGVLEFARTLLLLHENAPTQFVARQSIFGRGLKHRVACLLHENQDRRVSTMKKIFLMTGAAVILAACLFRVEFVEKIVAQDTKTNQESLPIPKDLNKPDEEKIKEAEKLVRNALASVEDSNATKERLLEIMGDLGKTYRIFRVDNHVKNREIEDQLSAASIAVCDRILAMKPDENLRDTTFANKFHCLCDLRRGDYGDESKNAFERFAEECNRFDTKWARELAKNARAEANNRVVWRLRYAEKPASEDFQSVLGKVREFLEDGKDFNAYLVDELMVVGEKLCDRSILSRAELRKAYETMLTSCEKNESSKWILDRIKQRKELFDLVGRTPMMKGTLLDGKPFDWGTYKGKTVLIVFPAISWKGPDMGMMLSFQEQFADKGLELVTVVETPDSDKNHPDANWLPKIVEKYRFPGTVATSMQTDLADLRRIPELNAVQEYQYIGRTFLLVAPNGEVVSLADAERTREHLVEMLGEPEPEKTAKGKQRANDFHYPPPCSATLRTIALAMHKYHDTYGSFPPAYTVDANGNKLHSWRVLLLPFMDCHTVYSMIRLDEPWNSEHNRKVYEQVVFAPYQCHESLFHKTLESVSNYAVVVGPGTIFPENGQTRSIKEITDGTSNTILLIERETPVPWMEPTDISFADAVLGVGVKKTGIGSPYHLGSNCAFADAFVRFLPNGTDPKTIRDALTCGGENGDMTAKTVQKPSKKHVYSSVIDAETNKPMAGVKATLYFAQNGKVETRSTQTDAEGKIVFPLPSELGADMEAGMDILVEKDGYVSEQDGRQAKWSQKFLDEGKEICKTFPLQKAETITGRLVDEQGKPMPNMMIVVFREKVPPYRNDALGIRPFNIKSDASGKFRIGAVKNEKIAFWAVSNDLAPKYVFPDKKRGNFGDIVVEKGFRPTIQVLDKDGKPVEDVWVNLNRNGENYGMSIFTANQRSALTDREGFARLGPMTAGNYEIRINERGMEDISQNYSMENSILWRENEKKKKEVKGQYYIVPVDLSESSPKATIRAQSTVKIDVAFSDKQNNDCRDLNVNIYGRRGDKFYAARPSSGSPSAYRGDGLFSFPVPIGLEKAELRIPSDGETAYRCRKAGTEDWIEAFQGMDFPLGPITKDTKIDVTVYRSPKITLNVVDEAGKPVKEFYGWAEYADTKTPATVKFNGDGIRIDITPERFYEMTWEWATSELTMTGMLDVHFKYKDFGKSEAKINSEGILPDRALRLYVVGRGYEIQSLSIPGMKESEEKTLTVTLKKAP